MVAARMGFSKQMPLSLCAKIVFIGAMFAFGIPIVRAQSGHDAVLLKQHSAMVGDVDVLVGDNGFSMSFRKMNLFITMQAPLWHITYCNTSRKIYYSCTPKQMKANPAVFSAMFRPSSPTSLRSSTSEKTIYKGLPCTKFRLVSQEAVAKASDKTWKRLMPKDGTSWVLARTHFPHEAYRLASNLMALPVSEGIPVAFTFQRYDNEVLHELALFGFEKKKLKGKEFDPPPGFALVTDQNKVFGKGVEEKDFAEFLKE
ncbi:MAG: hypothetical protein IAF58_18255 [Leptolyngbya sp.]|nr:hypothetical protein [Candidatus Melainabacteria bacterium]